jgi:glutamine cyclotransferase
MNHPLRTCCLALLLVWAAFLATSCAISPGTPPASVAPTATPILPTSTPISPTPTPIPPTATPIPPTSTPLLTPSGAVPVYTYRIVNAYPHDPHAFTEGLVFQDGVLYESTGLWGESTLRRVELETGAVLQSLALSPEYFAEGVTVHGGRIYQLTWKSHVGFVYDKDSFDLLGQFEYPTEGWGLTQDGQRLIMSDGTASLHFLDPNTLEEIGQVQAHDQGQPLVHLNELEYVHGEVFANVWQTSLIARIDPATGQVVGWIDLTGILKPEDVTQPVDVLNGIAYDAETDRLFVTGKWWPKLFQIQLVPQGG